MLSGSSKIHRQDLGLLRLFVPFISLQIDALDSEAAGPGKASRLPKVKTLSFSIVGSALLVPLTAMKASAQDTTSTEITNAIHRFNFLY